MDDRPTTSAPRPERRVVVGIDGSPAAAQALEQARVEARLMDAHLDVVWAWTLADVPHGVRSTASAWAAGPDLHPPGPSASQAWAATRVAGWAAPGADGPRSMAVRAVWGAAGPVLVEAGAGADLVVVGAHAHLRGLHLHLGSVSRHVVDHATTPVMIVRPPSSSPSSPPAAAEVDPGGPIVVGVDGSAASRRALTWALHEAARRQVGVIAVHGWDVGSPTAGPVPTTLQPALLLERAAQRVVDDELARTVAVVPTVPRSGLVLPRTGAGAVVDVAIAESAGLAVVGTRGRGTVAHRVLGSVSHRVVAIAPVPVVTVP